MSLPVPETPALLGPGVSPYFVARRSPSGEALPPRYVPPVPRPAVPHRFAVAAAREAGLRAFAYGGFVVRL